MLLLVSATSQEVAPLCPNSTLPIGEITPLATGYSNALNVLITGVGSVSTTFHLLSAISKGIFTTIINLGIAGSYIPNIGLGQVVVVERDTFADYGIDDNGKFYSLFDKKLANPNQFPFENGWIQWNSSEHFSPSSEIPRAKGITVSTATGSTEIINRNIKHFSPDIETMEGAAVFYVCSMLNIPFICLRGISNMVEPRDSSQWNINMAINAVCNEAQKLMGKLP